jgi:hypothetical protein
MDLELPAHLHATRDLLTRSLVSHSERAPAMPAGLAADLIARFETRGTPAPAAATRSWALGLKRFFATPAFGAAAAAVLVLGTAMPLLDGPSAANNENFRGGSTVESRSSVRIIFIGEEPGDRAAVESSGNFESASLMSVEGIEAALELDGAKVLVDFSSRKITAFDASGKVVHDESMPEASSQLGDAIAKAVTRI